MTQFINTQRGSKGEKGDPGKSGASLKSVAWDGNDMAFTDTDDHTVKLANAKIDLKGEQGNPGTPGAAATISVGTTTTGNPGTNASVTNSGTSSAAVFNFTIPRGADGQNGQDGAAATISAGTASTLPAGSTPTVTNSGTSSAAVFNFGIPKGDTGATGNGIASVTSSKSGKVTTVTITETDGDSSSFTVTDGDDGEGSGDVSGPSSSVDGHLAVFDGTTGKLIKDGGAIPTPTTVVDNLTTQSATSALSANQGYVLDGKISTINGKIPSEASTSNKLADKNYVDDSINSITAYYITKNAAGDQFATKAELTAATTFYSGGVVRVPTRNDYCIVASDETHDNSVVRYIYQNGQWEYQYTVNETALTQAQLDALNSGITSTKVGQYDSAVTTISGYGNIVTHNTSEFATSAQGGKADSALQPNDNITELNNNAGYITGVDWGDIGGTLSDQVDLSNALGAKADDNAVVKLTGTQSIDGTKTYTTSPVVPAKSTDAAATNTTVIATEAQVAKKQDTLVSGTNIKTINNESILGSGNLTVAGGIGISTDANNILTSGASIWVGTEANYQALATKDSNCIYLTI